MKKKNNWIRGIIAAPVCAAALILAGCALEDEHSSPPKNMVWVQGGTFEMGGNNDNEKPVHSVTITGFYMGKHEVTQKEWREIMGDNPSGFTGDDLPVEKITWDDAVDYCNTLSKKEGLTPAYTITVSEEDSRNVSCDWNANGYRLPTEAEWEYAAKGGNGSPGNYEYSGSNDVDEVAWYNGNSGNTTHPVGSKMPNALGLYDMSGNVAEWCWDGYIIAYSDEAQTDPRGPSNRANLVRRGGSWNFPNTIVRSAYRIGVSPSFKFNNLGFRLVRPIHRIETGN